MPYNFGADSFHTKKLCSRLSSTEVRFFSIENIALIRHVTVITDNSHVLHVKDWKVANAGRKE